MKEIERKYLIKEDKYIPTGKGIMIKQGYLSVDAGRVVRVRVADKKGFITIKGKMEGITRDEFEYEIPKKEAEKMLGMCLNNAIEKIRYIENFNGMTWEIDVFEKDNKGLVLAEIELESEDQRFDLPIWIKKEVTHDKRYYNSWLSVKPFKTWASDHDD